jgi:hypothetical protein
MRENYVDLFLTARQVRDRYGNASDMWLYRAEHRPDSTFPKPIRINGRRFYRLGDLRAWESSQAWRPRNDQTVECIER